MRLGRVKSYRRQLQAQGETTITMMAYHNAITTASDAKGLELVWVKNPGGAVFRFEEFDTPDKET